MKSNNKIKRTFDTRLIQRNEEGNGTVWGIAAVFDSPSRSGGWFEEVIDRDAFTNAVATSDVRALFNHDPNIVLARTKSGTLNLDITERGLEYRFDMPESRGDLSEAMKRGDIDQSSFAFTIKREEWTERDGDIPLRRILEVDRLYDVSVVTYPFYEETEAAVRSEFESQIPPKKDYLKEQRERHLHIISK